MDASNITLLYDGLSALNKNQPRRGRIDLITFHDCFGTHANDIEILSSLVKNAFISIYKDRKFLDKFHNTNVNNIKSVYTVKDNIVYFNKKQLTIPTIPKIENIKLEERLPKSLYLIDQIQAILLNNILIENIKNKRFQDMIDLDFSHFFPRRPLAPPPAGRPFQY